MQVIAMTAKNSSSPKYAEKLSLFERLSTGENVGKLPGLLDANDLAALGHPQSPIAAIRAKCLDCCAGSPSEVRKCVSIKCPLWGMRMGSNPYHGNGRKP